MSFEDDFYEMRKMAMSARHALTHPGTDIEKLLNQLDHAFDNPPSTRTYMAWHEESEVKCAGWTIFLPRAGNDWALQRMHFEVQQGGGSTFAAQPRTYSRNEVEVLCATADRVGYFRMSYSMLEGKIVLPEKLDPAAFAHAGIENMVIRAH